MGDTKYNRTFKGKMVRIYADMKNRTTNPKHPSTDQYYGLPLCSKEDFYDFSKNDPVYKALHKKWEESNFSEEYKPSIDRIVPEKGYVLSNMRWVTEFDNKSKNIDESKYELTDDGDLPF